jgi:hypothetical protein
MAEQTGSDAAPGVTDKDERPGLEQPEHAGLIGRTADARFAQGVATAHPREVGDASVTAFPAPGGGHDRRY